MQNLETDVSLMAKICACWSPSFSPDGKYIAFISNLNGIPQVWTVSTTGGWPKLATSTNDQIYAVSWAPTDEWLSYSLAPGGGMNTQIYLVKPNGTQSKLLTKGGKENNWLGRWSYDGKKLGMSSNIRTPEAMDAYLFDVETHTQELIAENKGFGYFTDLSRDNKLAILMRMVNRSDNNLYLIDIERKIEILLTPHEGYGTFYNARFSPDTSQIYLISNQNRERLTFGKIDLNIDKTPGPIEILIEKPSSELQMFQITYDGNQAAFVWNEAGKNKIELYTLKPLTKVTELTLPTEIVEELTFARDNAHLALTLSGSTSPTNIWVYNVNTRKLWQVTDSPHAGIDLKDFVSPNLVFFKAHDGLDLSGWLYKPHNFITPGPVVINFHGGPEAQEKPIFNTYYQALLSQDIAVFAPNVRGSSGFGKTFENLDNGPLRFNAVKDIKSCVEYLVNSRIADSNNLGIMGASYGGFMTMAGLTEYPDLFAAGANLFGVVNFETFFEHTEPWMAEISKIQYGDPETQFDLLRQLSPIHKIHRIKAATIVLHGKNDTNVPVIEAEQVVDNLRKRGIKTEYILFPDEGHGFSKTKNKLKAITEVTKWFKTNLNEES